MFYFFAILLALTQPATLPLNSLIDGVDRTFARMKDFSADFVQIDQNPLNRGQQGSGHLYLMKPRMMRMEYKKPDEQLYVSDGKTFYSYVTADRQARKEPVRDTIDDRIPLMLVVGRANLRGEFERFEESAGTKPVMEGTRVVRMFPRRKMDFTEFIIEVEPQSFQIRRLVAIHMDGTRSEFMFMGIQTNTGLKESLFHFTPPPGVEVLEGSGR